jgi:hypothetical protein
MSQARAVEKGSELRPFRVNIPDADLDELRSRIGATRWPERETVADGSQGVQLETIRKLARYWLTDYDWRKREAKLNALPQFVTEIDGVDIHFLQGGHFPAGEQPQFLSEEIRAGCRSLRKT